MELKGRIINLSQSMSGGYTIVLEIAPCGLDSIKKLIVEELSITLKKWREKRSLNANSYFHVLVGKIAEIVKRSPAYVKNEMIAECGYMETIDDQPAIIKSNIEPEFMMEQETLHTKVCKVDVEDNGTVTYFYRVYRGTHTYDTKEMSRLIDLTVYRAKELDIETMTPNELERIKQQWEKPKA